MFFKEEKKKWVGEQLARVIAERPNLTHREQRIMREYLEKEFENVWEQRDEVYGEQSGSQAGERAY